MRQLLGNRNVSLLTFAFAGGYVLWLSGRGVLMAGTLFNVVPMFFAAWLLIRGAPTDSRANLLMLAVCISKIGADLVKAIPVGLLNRWFADDAYRATINSMSGAFGAIFATPAMILAVFLGRQGSSAPSVYGPYFLVVTAFATMALPLYAWLRESKSPA